MNHPELLSKLTAIQASLWPAVTNQVGETTGHIVQLNSPLVLESSVDEAVQEFAVPAVLVQFSFAGQKDSSQHLMLPLDTATALYSALVEEDGELDEETVEALSVPLGAVVHGICVGLGNVHNEVVVASDIAVRIGRFARPSNLQPTDPLIRIQLAVGVESTIGSLTWLFDLPTAHFVAGLAQPPELQSASFSSLPPFGASRGVHEVSHGLDILMDVPLDITVELGRTRLVVKEVVDLGVGSIVEIEKAAGEPVDILVNGRIVARGEVVVIEDNFGVRITEILNPRERLARLSEAA